MSDRLPRGLRVALIAVPVALAIGIAGVQTMADGDTGAGPPVSAAPVDIASTAPRAVTLAELVTASDVVVLAEVIGDAPGRTITDPAQPTVGVQTRLVTLRVVEVVVGHATLASAQDVIMEQESTLLDGTPVRIDGIAPLEVGSRGIFFLVGPDPYFSLVGPQGSYLVDGNDLVASSDDPLAQRLAADGGPALVDAVQAVVATNE